MSRFFAILAYLRKVDQKPDDEVDAELLLQPLPPIMQLIRRLAYRPGLLHLILYLGSLHIYLSVLSA
jgi:hypothetical protein